MPVNGTVCIPTSSPIVILAMGSSVGVLFPAAEETVTVNDLIIILFIAWPS